MAQVGFAGVFFHYPGFAAPAVGDLDLVVLDGEFLTILGPSGSGKSTLLRLLTGIEKPSAGEILMAGEVITGVPPGERDVASVAPTQALYTHLTVGQNIGFAMSVNGVPPSIIAARVADIAGALGLARLLDRPVRALSTTERQAVFLARAMVRPVGALVLDEPLAHLDPDARRQARAQLRDLQRRTGTTTIYVTQDFNEAMILSDRIAVMIDGRLHQVAEPLEVYHQPAALPVAQFFGRPPMNTLTAVVTQEGARIGDLVLPVPADVGAAEGARVVVGVRAEAVHLLPRGATLQVTSVENTGTDAYVRGFLPQDAGRQQLIVRCHSRAAPRAGASVHVDVLDDDHVLFFDPVTGRRI